MFIVNQTNSWTDIQRTRKIVIEQWLIIQRNEKSWSCAKSFQKVQGHSFSTYAKSLLKFQKMLVSSKILRMY